MTAQTGPLDVDAILAENAGARAGLMAAIEAVLSDQRVASGVLDRWSLKDVMVHIAAWQEAPATVFGILGAGEGWTRTSTRTSSTRRSWPSTRTTGGTK